MARYELMVAARSTLSQLPAPDAGEQSFILHNVSWRDYLVLRNLLDSPALRMAYCEGELELMSPSEAHEHTKTLIARLLEMFAIERDVPLHGKGSTTYRAEAKARGLEPDECYFVGQRAFQVHALTADGYVQVAASALVPGLDFEVLATFVRREDQHNAVREFRDRLRA